MDKITVDKENLINLIRVNKQEHIGEYEEALQGYKGQYELFLKKALVSIQKHIKDIRDSDYQKMFHVSDSFDSPVPKSHADDYDAILSMLNLHCDDKIELSYKDHQSVVMDNWAWKNDFVRTASCYK